MRIAIALLLVVVGCKTDQKAADEGANKTGGNPSQDPRSVGVNQGSGAAPGEGSPTPTPPPSQPQQQTPTTPDDPNAVSAQQAKVNAQLAGGAHAEFTMTDGGAPSDLHDVDVGSNGTGPVGKIVVASKTSFDTTNLSADAVAQKISGAYMATLARCYRNSLARDASIKGAASLDLTVKPDGAVGVHKASAPDQRLQTCFTDAVAGWTFPVPKNADGDATDAAFQITLALTPE